MPVRLVFGRLLDESTRHVASTPTHNEKSRRPDERGKRLD
jgi:hypothetical protein